MKFIATILMLLSLFISVVVGGALPQGLSRRSASDLPYPVGRMSFIGTLGGHEVQLNGSIEEMHAQMKVIHPDFDPDALVQARKLARENGPQDERNIMAREANNKAALYCCPNDPWGWSSATTSIIEEGIDYLNHFNGLCGVGARSCVRISCSWNSGIYLCNDAYNGITPSCVYMASYAQDIIDDCRGTTGWNTNDIVCGQKFDTDNYNIIVHWDRC
ncbi:hypothetical protein BDZ45DRAFT_720358 [Acephala macrosclerotiorum]|nr:hypothetical protein BDZ45DRAFT_720358 [Acephala macrosclerotiorum]